MSHTRCYAQAKKSLGVAQTSVIVGHLMKTDDGQWWMVDCDGDKMPLNRVLKDYEGVHVCINVNNLAQSNGNWTLESYHSGN